MAQSIMKNQLMIFPREGWTFFCTRARAHLGVWPLLLLLLTPQLRNWTFQYDLHKKVNLMPIFSRQAEFSWSAPRILVTTFFGQCIFHVMLVFFSRNLWWWLTCLLLLLCQKSQIFVSWYNAKGFGSCISRCHCHFGDFQLQFQYLISTDHPSKKVQVLWW